MSASPLNPATDHDVLIVGYGPVGQVLAILLAQRGWRVGVVERWPRPYALPRAVGFDDETARILGAAGIGDSVREIGEPTLEYDWQNAAGQTLLHFDIPEVGLSGLPAITVMHQPLLESTLAARGEKLSNLQVLRGHEAVQLVEHGDHVELVATGPDQSERTFMASWVVGCDGANSFVRDRMGVTVTDLGFSYDWLVCDVVLTVPRDFKPANLQICDPARPTTAVSGGPGRRRWEFMRMPGEAIADLNKTETGWRLLAPFDVTPENATLDRHTVYSFRARWADQWRAGRMLVAGDAAHLMPPFTAQGMCAGIRDAANLAWKLDLILRGLAGERLLDTYTVERVAHVRNSIETSVALGQVVCELDPAVAAQRDAAMLAMDADPEKILPQPLPPPLPDGVLHRGADGAPAPAAGTVTLQARVAHGDRVGLVDEVIGRGFVLAATEDPHRVIGAEQRAFLDRLGAHVVHLLPAGSPVPDGEGHAAVDVDDVYLPYLSATGAVGLLARPDFMLFGLALDADGPAVLVEDLRRQLTTAAAAPCEPPVAAR